MLQLVLRDLLMFDLHPSTQFGLWLHGRDVDRTAGGVLAEKSPLRAAQNFDLLDIDHAHDRGNRAREINPVDVDTDSGFESGANPRRTDSANPELRRLVEPNGGLLPVYVRNQFTDLVQLGDATLP